MDQMEHIHRLIYDSIDAIKDILPPDTPLASTSDAPLLESTGGSLDSLGVVNLMVEIENRIEAEFARTVSLAPALAEAPETSPFRTVATLATYVHEHLASETDD